MASIDEFRISIPQEKLDLTRKRLELATFPDEITDAGWDYGAPLNEVKKLHQHWLNDYDWRSHEKKLNEELPQFTTDVDIEGFGTLKIHFVHKQSDEPNAIPLIFAHGWPGSFIEVKKILPELISGGQDRPAFHVVAPSLPGYGFSEGAKKKGFGPAQCAEALHKVMMRLNYTQYVTQGGDWGYIVTRMMGYLYPSNVMASHLNMWGPPKIPRTQPLLLAQQMLTPLSEYEKKGVQRRRWFANEGRGYYIEQATKPQTIGYSQTDSPVGLLAWIYEKLHDWTDNYPWTSDEVITWISIYVYSTAGPAAASRLYYEANHDSDNARTKVNEYIPQVKLGLARFPQELVVPQQLMAHVMGPVVYTSTYDRGGHFAAWERPDAIVKDLRTMFGKGGGAFGVVKGKSGYSTNNARL